MRIFRILTLLALAAVIPMKAGAGPIVVGDVVNFSDLPGNTGGGEFKLTDISNAADWIISFCMQQSEHMNFTNNFIVGSINDYTLTDPDDKGGVNGQDPISSYTAWLYTQFTDGTLSKYDYNNTGNDVFASHEASANALQHAFWGFEQEETLDQNNYFVQLAMNSTPSNFGIGDVRVLEMRAVQVAVMHLQVVDLGFVILRQRVGCPVEHPCEKCVVVFRRIKVRTCPKCLHRSRRARTPPRRRWEPRSRRLRRRSRRRTPRSRRTPKGTAPPVGPWRRCRRCRGSWPGRPAAVPGTRRRRRARSCDRRRPRTPPWDTGLPVTQPIASTSPGCMAIYVSSIHAISLSPVP